jgi:hypothetical protein
VLIATAVAVWLSRTFRRTKDAIIRVVVADLSHLGLRIDDLSNRIDGQTHRVSDWVNMCMGTTDRVQHLESHAASVASVNEAFRELHERLIPVEKPPSDVKTDFEMSRWAITKALNSPSAHKVGHPFTIYEATYGVDGGPQIDVKKVLERNINDNRIRMKVTNETMGRDPLWGVPKQLRVRYSYDGFSREETVAEGGEVKIPD